jgi:RNA polymerase sigma factor (sigma-70 family)
LTSIELTEHCNALRQQVGAKIPEYDVDDLSQDIWVAMLEKLGTLTNSKQVGRLKHGIAKHKIADYYRNEKDDTISIELIDYRLAVVEASDNELPYDIDAGLAALDDELRDILRLRYWLCLTNRQIAMKWGCKEGHIETRRRTALARLRLYFSGGRHCRLCGVALPLEGGREFCGDVHKSRYHSRAYWERKKRVGGQ